MASTAIAAGPVALADVNFLTPPGEPHMSASITNQIDYWNGEGPTKVFHHPVDFELLDRYATPQSRVLDYGCGYGRVAAILHAHGYHHVIGVDFSSRMIEAGREAYPHLNLVHPHT